MEDMTHKFNNRQLYTSGSQAKNYALYRPTYPSAVFETIFNFCKENSNENKLTLDVGCGSGQGTLPLTKYFSNIIGVDVSPEQISNAPTDVPGLAFRVSAAEELDFVMDGSVDLITLGESLHWIDLEKFYPQVDRILKPGGSVVAYGYTSTMNVDHSEINDYILHIHRERLAGYWGKDVKHVENKYSCIPSPYDDWLRKDDIVMENYFTVKQLIGYMDSWSSVVTYRKQNRNSDLIGEIREKIASICSQGGDFTEDKVVKVTWPIFVLMARKPGIKIL